MKHILTFLIALIMILSSCTVKKQKGTVSVFYKNRTPSLKVLNEVKNILNDYEDKYIIAYYDIEDEANLSIISELGLPETHFPFAIVINGSYTIKKDAEELSFVHFPTFMNGIGRHEGNWSLDNLKEALSDNTILQKVNILPELDEENETTECED